MALQIANPIVVDKVERMARLTGMTKTALVEKAVDLLANDTAPITKRSRIAAILTQMDRIPDRPDAHDPLLWDDAGLPK